MVTVKIKLDKKIFAITTSLIALGAITVGFLGFYTLIVPELVNLASLSTLAILIFGFGAGILSFFAPCSLAIFPGYMGYFLSETNANGKIQASKLGSIAALGMILFYASAGLFISFIGGISSVQSILGIGVPLMAIILGAVGIYFLKGQTINMNKITELGGRLYSKDKATNRNLFLFGFGYSLSSIACIFPVFLLLIVYPLITGNITLGTLAFVSFAAGKSILFISATVLISESKSNILTSKAKHFNYIKQGSGLLLILVSLYLAYYSLTLYNIIQPVSLIS
ncbi:MAG: cytochrome c biogenesis protein CcdA [Candidatus Nanohaloarchaea archaeon]|nr:cytochrome c biogenesis protein CcdA [Candidatus Nanohaloarchaea archaeon]